MWTLLAAPEARRARPKNEKEVESRSDRDGEREISSRRVGGKPAEGAIESQQPLPREHAAQWTPGADGAGGTSRKATMTVVSSITCTSAIEESRVRASDRGTPLTHFPASLDAAFLSAPLLSNITVVSPLTPHSSSPAPRASTAH
jgi:hypothetical protein